MICDSEQTLPALTLQLVASYVEYLIKNNAIVFGKHLIGNSAIKSFRGTSLLRKLKTAKFRRGFGCRPTC